MRFDHHHWFHAATPQEQPQPMRALPMTQQSDGWHTYDGAKVRRQERLNAVAGTVIHWTYVLCLFSLIQVHNITFLALSYAFTLVRAIGTGGEKVLASYAGNNVPRMLQFAPQLKAHVNKELPRGD